MRQSTSLEDKISAIVGIYYIDGRPVEPIHLKQMTDTLAHRGPDAEGMWHDKFIGLGHRMAWTTPESIRENLPLSHYRNRLVITADVRLDNRDDLVDALDIPAPNQSKIADSELILAAYEKWGELCPEKLLGDFVFAIWDAKRQMLFLARDHFGIKHFYYYSSSQIFAFATEIKALLCLPGIRRSLNERRVADFLTKNRSDTTSTFYRDIFRLPAGHSMSVSKGGTQTQRYWSLDPTREIKLKSDEEYAEAFRSIFVEAVRCRVRNAGPVGAELSGGLDSSAIVCAAKSILASTDAEKLHTFSCIHSQVKDCDESFFIHIITNSGGLSPHYYDADQVGPVSILDQILQCEDEVVFAPNLYEYWEPYRVAQQNNIRILLSGFDGDSTVSHGLSYLDELSRKGKWLRLAIEVFGLAKRHHPTLWTYKNPSPWSTYYRLVRRGLSSLLYKNMPQTAQAMHQIRHRGKPIYTDKYKIINPTFMQRMGIKEVTKNTKSGVPTFLTPRMDHYDKLSGGGLPLTLEECEKMAGAFAIEARYPFFDKRLLEFCLALPVDQKIHYGWTRIIERRAMTGILPPQIQWRRSKAVLNNKNNYGQRIVDRDRLNQIMNDDIEVASEYLNVDYIRQEYLRYMNEKSGDNENCIWRSAILTLWLKQTGLKP